jgi:hypothetical protein
MTTRTAQIVVTVEDKSLTELNNEIKDLQKNINGLKVGTQEWVKQNEKLGVLKNKFRDATDEAKNLQKVIQKVSGSDQLRSIAKLGAGMVGAFAAVNGIMTQIGGNDALGEVTAKATKLISIFAGLNQLAETFSSTNLKGLKSIGQGFTSLVTTVKGFSTATKAALISTGIGALVVVIGLIAANWDKLVKLVDGSNRKLLKSAEDLVKTTKLQEDLTKEQVTQQTLLVNQQYELNIGKTAEYNTTLKTYDLGNLTLKNKEAEIVAQEALVAKLKIEYDQIGGLFGIGKKKKQAEKDLEIQRAAAALETMKTEKEVLGITQERLTVNKDIASSIEEHTKKLAELENQLIKVNAKEFSTSESYAIQIKQIDEQILGLKEKLYVNGQINVEINQQIDRLNATRDALAAAEVIRKRNLELDIETIKIEIKKNKFISDYNEALYDVSKLINEENLAREKSLLQLERSNELTKLDYEGLRGAIKIRDEIVNFDAKRNKLLKERTEQLIPAETRVTKESYEQMKRFLAVYAETFNPPLKSIEFFADVLKTETDNFKKQLETQTEITKQYDKRSKFGKQIIDDAANEVALKRITNDIIVKTYDKEIDALNSKLGHLFDIKQLNIFLLNDLRQQQRALEEQLASEQELYDKLSEKDKLDEKGQQRLININTLNNNLASIKNDIMNTDAEVLNIFSEQEDIQKQILDTTYERENAASDVKTTEDQVTNALIDQLRVSAKLQDFTKKYNEEIQVGLELVKQSLEFLAVEQDNLAKNQQKNIDAAIAGQELLNSKEEARKSTIEDLKKAQEDANGQNYTDLQNEIDLQEKQRAADKQDWIDKENARVTAVNAQIKAEKKAANLRKASAIIDGIIQTALAVIKALPNIALSIAVGILGAANVATMSAQKTATAEPEVAQKVPYKKGGFTGIGEDDEVAGIVHKNEFVVPAKVVKSAQARHHIAALESQRLKGYAEGGYVTPIGENNFGSGIDYEKFISGMVYAISKLPNPQVSLVAISNGLHETQLTKNNAGISR